MTLRGAIALGAAMATALSPATFADDQEEIGDGITVYDPTFFERFAPANALDAVRRVPGFSIDSGGGARGLSGVSGNVLIDGVAPSLKGGVGEFLQRIPFARVERVELIRGGVAGVDLRGRDVVVNLVLREADGSIAGSWEVRPALNNGERVSVPAEVSLDVSRESLEARFGLEFDDFPSRRTRTEELFDADLDLIEATTEGQQQTFFALQPTMDLRWAATERDAFSLTIEGRVATFASQANAAAVDALGAPAGFILEDFDEDEWGLEIGADWERALTASLSSTLIGFYRDNEEDSTFVFTELEGDGAFDERSTRDRVETDGERILAGTLAWEPDPQHALDMGLEFAHTFLDITQDIASDDGDGPDAINLARANTEVEEDRYEAFVTYIWRPDDRLSLETEIAAETSTLSLAGDAQSERTLDFVKPRVAATWDVARNTQVRASLSREVAQLNFGAFASSVSFDEDNVTLSNPDLEPERTWRHDLELERRFAERGVVTLALRYDRVEMVQSTVPVGDDDGPGNIGNGDFWRVDLDIETPLDAIGVPNALLELSGRYGDSAVTDPFLGAPRQFRNGGNRGFWRIDFRQDLPERKLAWGFDAFFERARLNVGRDRETRTAQDGVDLDAFIESTHWPRARIRFGLDNILDNSSERVRTRYDGEIADGVVRDIEVRTDNGGPRAFVQFTGTF